MLAIDFEKAFDSISHKFILRVLKAFNFGPSIIKWFCTFYKNASSSVLVNGYPTDSFQVERGCRQGDPLSPYLFILCTQVLNLMIKNNNSIRGILMNECEVKLTQYADDTTFLFDGSISSFRGIRDTLTHFDNLSGLRINFNKSLLIGLGSLKNQYDTLGDTYGIPWNRGDNFVLLGIIFNVDLREITQINYDNALSKIKKIINSWSRRNISTLGKITVLKSLIITHINYLLLTLPSPSADFLSDLNSLFFSFVWNKKPDRVNRNQIIQDYSDGGLEMVVVRKYAIALKGTCVKRILSNDCNSPHACFSVSEIMMYGDVYIKDLISRTSNMFWKDVFRCFHHYLVSFNNFMDDLQLILSQPIWKNSRILIGNSPVMLRNRMKCGVTIINDFF